jgi:peptide/nickel transport system substrate-binding protein
VNRSTVVACVLGALLGASCTGAPEPPSAEDETFVVGTTEPLTSLDPATCYGFFCAYVALANTHEGLVRLDPDGLRPEPALAESWEVSEDGRIYTFRLREDVQFHDGTAVDADGVRRSLDRVRELGLPEGPSFLLFDQVAEERGYGIEAVQTPDDRTVVVRLARPDTSFLARLAFPVGSVVPREGYPPDREAEDILLGTGPFELAPDGLTPDAIELRVNTDYWGPQPSLDRVRIRRFASGGQLRTAVRRGDVHLALLDPDPAELEPLRDAQGLRLVSGPSATTRFLVLDTGAEPFDDPGVRRAVAAAIDRRALSSEVLGETAQPLSGLLPQGMLGYSEVFASGRGSVDDHLQGTGVESGARVAVDLWFTPSHYGATEGAVAEALERMLEDTGRFAVEVHTAEWTDFKARIAAGRLPAFLLGWFPDVLDPDGYLAPFVSTQGAAAVGSRYSDPEVDGLLEQARATRDSAERQRLYDLVQTRVAEAAPYVPLWQPLRHVAVRTGVTGVRLDLTQQIRFASISVAR